MIAIIEALFNVFNISCVFITYIIVEHFYILPFEQISTSNIATHYFKPHSHFLFHLHLSSDLHRLIKEHPRNLPKRRWETGWVFLLTQFPIECEISRNIPNYYASLSVELHPRYPFMMIENNVLGNPGVTVSVLI